MDIFIKSFNRPYNLDRCIFSVRKFVENYVSIIILDDGTPKKYLDRIQEKYPEVVIKKSEFYEDKATAIETDTMTRQKLKFPGEFWHREISKGSDYFLLLEDDFFVTNSIDLLDIEHFMRKEKLSLYKLIWQGRKEFKDKEVKKFGENQLIRTSKKYYSSENFRRLSYDKFRIRDFMEKRIGIGSYFKRFMLPYYKFYTVAGAVVDKNLFLAMWEDISKHNEFAQLYRLLRYYEDKGENLSVGKSAIEAIETTYLSSATNDFPGISLSVFDFNRRINEAWYSGDFDPCHRFPKDNGRDYFKKFIPESQHLEYDKWIAEFAGNYINLGCRVETN